MKLCITNSNYRKKIQSTFNIDDLNLVEYTFFIAYLLNNQL